MRPGLRRSLACLLGAGLVAGSIRLCATAPTAPVPQPDAAVARPFAALLLPPATFFRPDERRVGARAVFAWYLPCCGAFGGTAVAGDSTAPNPAWPAGPMPAAVGVEQYRRAILLAQAAGFDGFALDEFATAASLTASDKANIAAVFEAARQLGTGFRLYLVFDQAGHDARDYRDLLRIYARHPNYYHYRGLPVASAYGATHVAADDVAGARWWSDRVIGPAAAALGTPIFWTPVGESAAAAHCTPPLAAWTAAVPPPQGLGAWQIQTAPIGGGLPCQERYAAATRAAGLAWVGSYSWHYWVGSSRVVPGAIPPAGGDRSSTAFEHGGGKGLADSWASMIAVQQPAWITMLTANDFNESYGETIDDYAFYRARPGNGVARFAPVGWYQDQSGMAALDRYYIQWYRTGTQPAIEADALFASYRTMPEAYRAPATNAFAASLDDGHGRAGTLLRVDRVEQGYVVPGERLHGPGVEGDTILEQLGGRRFGPGLYRIARAGLQPSRRMTSSYDAERPRFERGGEPEDPVYLTAAVTGSPAVLTAYAGPARYPSALVDGRMRALPVSLGPGLHQITIAPFRPGVQRAVLSRAGRPTVEFAGRAILRGGPVYDFFPFSGYAIKPRSR